MFANKAARMAGVTVKALRYYEGVGLLRPVRGSNGYRDYTFREVRLAREIKRLSSFGLATKEAKPFLDCLQSGHAAADECPESLEAYQDKLRRLDQLIARLYENRSLLAQQLRLATERGVPPRSVGRKDPPRPDQRTRSESHNSVGGRS